MDYMRKMSGFAPFMVILVICLILIGGAFAVFEFLGRQAEQEKFNENMNSFWNNFNKKSEKEIGPATDEDLAKGPDWYLTYYQPTCVKKTDGTPPSMGAQRVHWIKGKLGDITGSAIEGSPITFSGTYSQNKLDFYDKAHFSDGTPIHIVSDLSTDRKSLKGTFSVKAGNINFAGGDCAGVEVAGQVGGEPCQNSKGTGCP